jgi:hypothetical protein
MQHILPWLHRTARIKVTCDRCSQWARREKAEKQAMTPKQCLPGTGGFVFFKISLTKILPNYVHISYQDSFKSQFILPSTGDFGIAQSLA